MTDQPFITLNDGRRMPQLGFGVFKVEGDEAERIVGSAIDVGYRAVDTAAFYGNEEGVGAAVRASNETIFVTSKMWLEEHGADRARRAFDATFDRLGLDWLDLYLIHWPAPERDLYVETWKTFVQLRDEGKVKSIGVSNFTIEQLERIIDATGVVPAVNQVELHPSFQQVELRAFHEANGIATTSWSPLGQGKALADPVLARIGDRYGKTPAQVVIRWHLDEGLVVIPKAAGADRQRENFDVFDFTLDADDRKAIAGLDRQDGRIGPHPDNLN